jgi:glucokinase
MKVVDYIWEVYSRVLTNFSMLLLPKGGIFLTGSLTNSLAGLIKRRIGAWREENIRVRPYMRELLEQIPVLHINEEDIGLKGARTIAQRIAVRRGLL